VKETNMVPATVVRQRKGQHVVAVPATVARHLVMAPGSRVYWAMPRTGQALLSVKPTAARGKERQDVDCSSCAAYRKEIERLRAKLVERPLRVLNQGVAQGWSQAQRHLGVTSDRLETIEAKLDQLSARIPFGRTRRNAAQTAPRSVEMIPSPSLASPSS
jgi:hypothetical protein